MWTLDFTFAFDLRVEGEENRESQEEQRKLTKSTFALETFTNLSLLSAPSTLEMCSSTEKRRFRWGRKTAEKRSNSFSVEQLSEGNPIRFDFIQKRHRISP